MPTLPENLSDYVRRTLVKNGVEVMTSSCVMSCDAHGVELEHGRLDADTIIWAAGVVASGGTVARCGARSRRAGEDRRRSVSFGSLNRPLVLGNAQSGHESRVVLCSI